MILCFLFGLLEHISNFPIYRRQLSKIWRIKFVLLLYEYIYNILTIHISFPFGTAINYYDRYLYISASVCCLQAEPTYRLLETLVSELMSHVAGLDKRISMSKNQNRSLVSFIQLHRTWTFAYRTFWRYLYYVAT